MNPSSSPSRRGFTLIELLVVIAIIGLLAAFLFPAVRGAMRSAQTSRSKSNMKQIVAGTLQYKDDNDYFFPNKDKLEDAGSVAKSLAGGAKGDGDRTLDPDRALYTFIRDSEIFESPSDRGAKDKPVSCASVYEKYGSSYLYVGNSTVGLMGMTVGNNGRKYTDPYLGASSLKILYYEPPFLNPAGKADTQAQWHDTVVGTVAGFLDGHVDFVKKAAETLFVKGTSGGNPDTELRDLAESKRGYY
jgi:prepilin-type N-terminal cleavage/methylation domain-containing protein